MDWIQIVVQRHASSSPIQLEFRHRQAHFISATSKKQASSQDIQLATSHAAKFRVGTRQGAGLVILGLGFSRSAQIKEVALTEYVSEGVFLDTLVKPQASSGVSQFILAWRKNWTNKLWSRKVASSGTDTDRYLDFCAIVILVWHSTYFDLILLSNLLEFAGANSPLLSKAKGVHMVPHVRVNVPLPERKPFPAFLSTIFPIQFPRNELVGRIHRALVDCQQTRHATTRLVKTAFEGFAKSTGNSGKLVFSWYETHAADSDNWVGRPNCGLPSSRNSNRPAGPAHAWLSHVEWGDRRSLRTFYLNWVHTEDHLWPCKYPSRTPTLSPKRFMKAPCHIWLIGTRSLNQFFFAFALASELRPFDESFVADHVFGSEAYTRKLVTLRYPYSYWPPSARYLLMQGRCVGLGL